MATESVINVPRGLSDADACRLVTGSSLSQQAYLDVPATPWRIELLLDAGRPMSISGLGIQPPWLIPTLSRLVAILNLPMNWDSYGAPPIEQESVIDALHFLIDSLSVESALPTVVPTTRGGVQVEWHRGGVEVEIEFNKGTEASAWYVDPKTGEDVEQKVKMCIPHLRKLIPRG